MVHRLFVEKKEGLDSEANTLCADLASQLQIEDLEKLRIFNRYDVGDIDKALFKRAVKAVFCEPQLDQVYVELPKEGAAAVFAVEYLPGQFDQRADSAEQCIQLISCGERPRVRTAKVYMLFGELTYNNISAIKRYLINPVECREASMELPKTLKLETSIPESIETLKGFTGLGQSGLESLIRRYGLAMDGADIAFCQQYFIEEGRDPTITEIRMIDTYWSDHCRHTTFLTAIDGAELEDEDVKKAFERYLAVRKELYRTAPVSLMDIATIGARYLKHTGDLTGVDESDEINACTVKVNAHVDGKSEPWLLLFKNETHNHPTEIEPFGGAATCIGGAIRDPLSGRAYVYQAMRVTGAADPLVPVSETIPGKLPQRKIVTEAANGYSSYGNQIGLATGLVDEIYHKGYAAKRMEIGAVVGAAPAKNVRREKPKAGDVVILLGGRTGRDGMGGATGSSKSHDTSSLETCGAEVQKGNAPEERKLQRLFRNSEATRLIKRCNDFGAGGVSVAIGELADGLMIHLNAIPKKYEGLDGTELAISESQERMAVVVAKEDAERFCALAGYENLEATVVAHVTDEPRLVMEWNGRRIVDIARAFLNSNGAQKHAGVKVNAPEPLEPLRSGSFEDKYKSLIDDLNVCSKRGLGERFDSTIGAGTVLMPFGGKYQLTPAQAMAAKLPVLEGDTTSCSVMAWGYNPFISERNPYLGAYLAVVESVAKLIATGAPLQDCYLTFQEYFLKLHDDPERWGKPFAALLGALDAQLDLKLAAIGGKDSMSGSFEDLDVPPTLVSFAVAMSEIETIISPEFKKAGSRVALLSPKLKENGHLDSESLLLNFRLVHELIREGNVVSAYAVGYGGIGEAVFKMCVGNGFGFSFEEHTPDLFDYRYGSFVLELGADADLPALCQRGGGAENGLCLELGVTTEALQLVHPDGEIALGELQEIYENKLEEVFACNIPATGAYAQNKLYQDALYDASKEAAPSSDGERPRLVARMKSVKPRVAIPVFPGTNCEYDTIKAIERAGGEAEVMVLRNLTPSDVSESVETFCKLVQRSQIIVIPGGFSAGDEPDGSGKFITAFFRNAQIRDATHELLFYRDGLIAGICNGFQALIKLGLVPFGKIIDTDENCPTLTYNIIGRHQSRIVNTRIVSNKSPWLMNTKPGEIYAVPVSHGEGRFICPEKLLCELFKNGQVATQYVDFDGNPTYDVAFNPNGSTAAVEGITSPDGRVFGKMAHIERAGTGLYKNVPGRYDMDVFGPAIAYFK